MPCRWKKKGDGDESLVVIVNVPHKNPDLPDRLIVTLDGPVADATKKMVRDFFEEVKKRTFSALKYSDSRIAICPGRTYHSGDYPGR